MNKAKKHIQLRRCGGCGKVGHNRSTCPVFILQKNSKPAIKSPALPVGAPHSLNFYIHHVNQAPSHSPHVVNLKNNFSEPLGQVTSVAPEKNATSFHDYHEYVRQVEKIIPSQSLFSRPLNQNPEKEKTKAKNKHRDNIKIFRDLSSNISALPCSLKKNINQTVNHTVHAAIKIADQTASALRHAFPWKKLTVALVLIAILGALPGQAENYYHNLKNTTEKIAANGQTGFISLKDSTTQMMRADIATSQASLERALREFDTAVSAMQSKHRPLQNFLSFLPFVGNEITSRQKLILAGQELALGNQHVLTGITRAYDVPGLTLTDRLQIFSGHLDGALVSYQKALENLSAVDSGVLPEKYRSAFSEFKLIFTATVDDLQKLANLNQVWQEIFGGIGERRYLLAFQNEGELRPTGGFVGSYAILDVKDGAITNIEVPPNGAYDFQRDLTVFVAPPTPLTLTNKRWEFQDANWFPDFPSSAKKLLWFFQHGKGITADGVITINSSVLEKLLTIMGPVTDTKRQITLTANNALSTIQGKVEEWGAEKRDFRPKQIITDLVPTFIENIKQRQASEMLPLFLAIHDSLAQKQIQAYFSDPQSETAVQSFGWGGEILSTKENQDYLMVVNTNIGGQKSDARIKQNISHQTEIQPDGTVIDTVIVTREHTGKSEEEFYGANNIDYIRLYVPEGSELLEAGGFVWPDEARFKTPENWYTEDPDLQALSVNSNTDNRSGTNITHEFGKTTFGNWVITRPGQTTQVQFIYRLPFKLSPAANNANSLTKILGLAKQTGGYQLLIQKQSGCNTTFESQIILPAELQPTWSDRTDVTLAANGLSLPSTPLIQDSTINLVFTQK